MMKGKGLKKLSLISLWVLAILFFVGAEFNVQECDINGKKPIR